MNELIYQTRKFEFGPLTLIASVYLSGFRDATGKMCIEIKTEHHNFLLSPTVLVPCYYSTLFLSIFLPASTGVQVKAINPE